jgi:hypothetical protein
LKTLFSSIMVFATLLCAHATAGTVTAVSYYHVEFEHYFVTANASEQAVLDSGAFAGWYRTGMRYKVESEPGPDLVPVCRFFSAAFGGKGTHFFTPFAQECALLHADPNWVYEGVAFYVRLPASDGTCAPGMAPVYRFYNANRNGAPNHIYTPARSHGVELLAAGWLAEGMGPDIVAFCVPTSADRALAQTQKLAGKTWSVPIASDRPDPSYPTEVRLQAGANPQVGGQWIYGAFPDERWSLVNWPLPYEVLLSDDYGYGGLGGWDPFADTFAASFDAVFLNPRIEGPIVYANNAWGTVTYFDSADATTSQACAHPIFENAHYRTYPKGHPFQRTYLGRCYPGVVQQM